MIDPESGLAAVKVTLMQRSACKGSTYSPALLRNGKEAGFQLAPDVTSFELENLDLKVSVLKASGKKIRKSCDVILQDNQLSNATYSTDQRGLLDSSGGNKPGWVLHNAEIQTDPSGRSHSVVRNGARRSKLHRYHILLLR